MKAVQAMKQGGPEVFSVKQVECPEPDPSEVLVDVKAAGVNVIDGIVRSGFIPDSMQATFPWIPGWDVSGVVEETGPDVESPSTGDPVYGMAQTPESGETYAEYTTIDAGDLQPVPNRLSHTEAAALPLAGLTAHYALFEAGDLQPDDTVLIHAAAGGVGHLAAQLAKNSGATVAGTASGYNASYLDELGVDEFVNYREDAFEELLYRADLVIDAIGGQVLDRSIELASPGGRVVTLPQPPSDSQRSLADEKDVSCTFFSITSTATPGEWKTLDELVREEILTPTVSNKYTLEDADQAHDDIEEGHVRGKLVLELD